MECRVLLIEPRGVVNTSFGYVDIKVCAVTEVWSGLKLVLRKELPADCLDVRGDNPK